MRTVHLGVQVTHDVAAEPGLDIAFETLESHADDVTVMEFRADIRLLGEFQPQAVDALHVFGPQPRRMRPKVDVNGGSIGVGDFEREGPTFGETFPGESDAASQFL